MTTEDLKARMKQLKLPVDEGPGSSGYTSSSPGSSLSSRPARPRPSLGIPAVEPFGLGSPISRRQTPGSLNLGAPLSRERLRFGTFPQPSHDVHETKLQDIMKLTGVLKIDGKSYQTPIEDLQPLGDLGNGTCGHVVKMRHPESGKIIACKQMRRTGNSEETKRIVMDMDVVLKSHDCREIVVCLGCFITASDVWICMELMATCFDKLLKLLKKPVPEEICGKVAVATLNALSYLKETHGVIHRDVKPSNILLDYNGIVKLCDFGISGRLVDSKAKTRSAGCAAYMAPERINPPNPNKPDYDIRADVWSLGITLCELATGSFPYKDCNTEFEVLTKVIQEDPPKLPLNGFSSEFSSFVSDCLCKNYKERPKYKKLLTHPFIVKYRELDVDVGAWYHKVANHTGDPNKPTEPVPSARAETVRKSSIDSRPGEIHAFKPQPSPRSVKSWRGTGVGPPPPPTEPQKDPFKLPDSFNKLKFYTSPTADHSGKHGEVSPSEGRPEFSPRDGRSEFSPRDGRPEFSPRDGRSEFSPRDGRPEFSPRDGRSEFSSRDGRPEFSPRQEFSGRNSARHEFLRESTSSRRENAVSPRDSSYSRESASRQDYSRENAASRHEVVSPRDSSRHGRNTENETRHLYGDSSRLNGTSLSRNNFTTSYHGSTASNYLSRPSYSASRSHEEYPSAMKSPSNRYDSSVLSSREKPISLSETNSPRELSHGGTHRKYSFEVLDSSTARDYHYTPKGSRKYESLYTADSARKYGDRIMESPRRAETFEGQRKMEKSLESPIKNSSTHTTQRSSRESGLSPRESGLSSRESGLSPRESGLSPRESGLSPSSVSSRKYPALPVPEASRAREQTREGRSSFLPSWKFGSWTLSSPLNLRRLRTASSDRTSTFDSRRHQTGYRSLNERDKQYYSTSGKSDHL